MGIRLWIPSKDLSTWTTRLLKELRRWLLAQGLEASGPAFHRFYVINMGTEFELEVGVPVVTGAPGDGRVNASLLPAGRYANLTYTGRNNAYKGNKALVEWARENGVAWDRWDDPRGDAFACRYESYLSDRLTEPDKASWRTNVAIKIKD
jgi:effector-binding domain-containing protein